MPDSRRIPDPGFAGDAGADDPVLRAALTSYAADPGRHLEVFAALRGTRLLVPVVAVAGEDEVEMATALLTGRDGRRALLAFTGLESLAAWRADARPVPVAASLAARSALQEGASALVVDVAGPTTYAVEGQLLDGLARGWTLARTDQGLAWVECE